MQKLIDAVAALRSRISELRTIIVTMEGPGRSELREQLFRLEEVVCAMER